MASLGALAKDGSLVLSVTLFVWPGYDLAFRWLSSLEKIAPSTKIERKLCLT
jgi:hypothetical protein